MTAITWDQPADRIYQTGLDRGVLYLTDRSGVPWNGLKSVIEGTSGRSVTPLYLDGVKYGESQILGEFAGSITALTYPDEFLEYEGSAEVDEGFYFKNQALKRFHLSYRTLIGDGNVGLEAGYKIHILYNLLAIPRDLTNQTMTNVSTPQDFGWTLSSVGEIVPGFKPVSHVVLDSRGISPYLLIDLEKLLYGSSEDAPTLPTAIGLKEYLETWEGITITDNGDGTWTASASEQFIHMDSPTQFRITHANAEYLNEDTYTVSSGTDAD